VAAVTGFIAAHGGSLLDAAQHGDLESGRFFQRIEVQAASLPFGPDEFAAHFESVAREFQLTWHLSDTDVKKRVVILASREDHCLIDLLHRWRRGDLDCEIPLVISNHPDLRSAVEWHGVEFAHVPVTSRDKGRAMERIATMFDAVGGDVMVLARYMQILPADLCERYLGRIINIHHSFLPSFAGARPYHQALERGVKLIGATCHYVTPDLDAGPIIEQDTARIDHSDAVGDLVRIGQDIERTVLARGLRWHLEDRVLLNGRRTVVFR
jgi:formyltetrahydrofolate deformylase